MASGQEDFASRVEEYLASIKENNTVLNPKLKKEQKQLEELLDSYKKLCDKFENRCNIGGVDVKTLNVRQPEIQAILRPELYKDVREEKKEALRKGFSKKRIFTEEQKRICRPDPKVYAKDIGEAEKVRFCHILSSSPSKFHNSNLANLGRRTITHFNPSRTNTRENEKDRLARIFSTSSPFMKNSDFRKKKLKTSPEPKKTVQKKPAIRFELPKNKQMCEKMQTMEKIDKAVETDTMSSSTSSVSTQTDIDDIDCCESLIRSAAFSPCSYRKTLIADSYGGSSGRRVDKKRSQDAYAEALRLQIKEKKRLEKEKLMKELHQDQLIEKRVEEQSKQMQREYLKEQREYSMEQNKEQQLFEDEKLMREVEQEQSSLGYLMDQNHNEWNDQFELSNNSESRRRYDSENNSMILNESQRSRPPSPLVPAIKTKNILKNKQLLNGKSEGVLEIDKDLKYENILGQLGHFRRQLAREHQLLEKKLETGS